MAADKGYAWDNKVAIVGAGISGVAAAKHLAGLRPVVFEASDSIGGVWRHCSYRSTRLQTSSRDYEFSDYPWPDNRSVFPTYSEVLEYLQSYATHFDVLKFVQFNCKVVEVQYVAELPEDDGGAGKRWSVGGRPLVGRPVWKIGVQRNGSDAIEWYCFEFVVMCMGKYGDMPRLPSFHLEEGPEIFHGKVMHTLDYCKLDREACDELMRGKKVVIVGFKKSAIDLACECAKANLGPEGQPCTMVVRTLHWTVPNSYRIWGVPFFLFYSTRSAQFLQRRPFPSFLQSLYCLLSSPLRKGVSKFIESYLKWKLPLERYGLVPDHPFEEDYASWQISILPDNFFAEADQGRIRFKKTLNWRFWEGGLVLDDGTKLEADVVILSTGYDGELKLKSILPERYSDLIDNASDVMPLYRGAIHPRIPNMAFIGYLGNVSFLHSSDLVCKWLSRLLDNQFALPSVEKMLEQTNEEVKVMRETSRFYKRHCIATFSINHDDEICEDMGWTSWRKESWLDEAFSPYNNQDYREESDNLNPNLI